MDDKIKVITNPLKKRVPFFDQVVFAFFLNVAIILIVIFIKKSLPPEVPLFYGLSEGKDQLGTSLSLIIPPLLSISFIALNLLISLFTKDLFLKKTLIITSISTTILSTITVFKIIFLIGTF